MSRLPSPSAEAAAAAIIGLVPLVTPDGNAYVYTYLRFLSNLYLVEGLR